MHIYFDQAHALNITKFINIDTVWCLLQKTLFFFFFFLKLVSHSFVLIFPSIFMKSRPHSMYIVVQLMHVCEILHMFPAAYFACT